MGARDRLPPAVLSPGVCGQCGEKYFKPEILKKMDETYHDIFDRNQKPKRTLTVPTVSL